MSLFGPGYRKKIKSRDSAKDESAKDDLKSSVNDLHKKVQRLVITERRFSDFQQAVQNQSGEMLKEIFTNKDKYKTLEDRIERHYDHEQYELLKRINNIETSQIKKHEHGELIDKIKDLENHEHRELIDKIKDLNDKIENHEHEDIVDALIDKIENHVHKELQQRASELEITQQTNIEKIQELIRTVRAIENSISHSGPITKQFMDEANSKLVKLEDRVKELKNPKSTITVTAESKGPLTNGEIFSFGNAGKSANTGYVMMKSGRIVGMSLVSDRLRGPAHTQILVNSEGLIGSEIILEDGIKKMHGMYDKPYNVNAGDVINFITFTTNGTTINTVVSVLIELDN